MERYRKKSDFNENGGKMKMYRKESDFKRNGKRMFEITDKAEQSKELHF